MSRVKITAGSALDGGVMFSTENYYAIARYPKHSNYDRLKAKAQGVDLDDEQELEVVSGEVDPPIGGKMLTKIPFVAGLVFLITGLFFKNDREPYKTIKNADNVPTVSKVGSIVIMCIVLSVLAGFSYLVGSGLNAIFGTTSGTFWYGFFLSIPIPVMLVGIILLASHFLQGDMLNFHGAEHKVGNAVRKDLELTPENVSSQSIYHPNCSTNLVVNIAIVYPIVIGLLYAWFNSFILALIVGVIAEAMINVEILRLSTWIGDTFLSKVFNVFGLLAQKITVKEPEERHTAAAMAAMTKLLELEHGSRS